jgi:hypothetical protein
MAESFCAALECELLDRTTFQNWTEARLAVLDFHRAFYNPRRRHNSSATSRRPSSKLRRRANRVSRDAA